MNLLETVENDRDNSLSARTGKLEWVNQRMPVGQSGSLSASLSCLCGLAELKIDRRILIGGDHNFLGRLRP